MSCFQAIQSAKISSYKVNTKEQHIRILVNTESCRKAVLSEAHFRFLCVCVCVCGRGHMCKIGNILFLILHTMFFFCFLKRVQMKKIFKITVMNSKVLSPRNVFIPLALIFMTQHPWNLTFVKMDTKLGA
jgi:hypothetical protein